jgi:hypothetical protein
MRTKRLIDGLNNSQKIRVIINDVGFYTTVAGVYDMCFISQRVAVTMALQTIGCSQSLTGQKVSGIDKAITGIARTYNVYDHNDQKVDVQVQVDLCD